MDNREDYGYGWNPPYSPDLNKIENFINSDRLYSKLFGRLENEKYWVSRVY